MRQTPPKADSDSTLSRSARRKIKTRAALIQATQTLVLKSGYEQVTIQDITEAADVGLGTFYNYFDSKTAVLEAVVNELNDEFFAQLDLLQTGVTDPAKLFVITLRYSLCCLIEDTPWAFFVVRLGVINEDIMGKNAVRVLNELEMASKAGRFDVDDPYFALMMLKGLSSSFSSQEAFGFPLTEALVQKSIYYVLRMLGMVANEALELSQLTLKQTVKSA